MLVTCAHCQRRNRILAANLARQVRCGACKTALTPIATPIDADVEVFDDVVQHAPLPVLVDFWAAWCGPCRMAAPEVQRTALEVAGSALVLKVDTDKYPEIAARYNVQGIPNFVVLKDGQVVAQQAGVVNHARLKEMLYAANKTAAH